MRRALYALPLAILLGCSSTASDAAEPPADDGQPPLVGASTTTGAAPPTGNAPPATPPPPPPDATLSEVVHVVIDGSGLCTGTLISKTMVVTAAHCLDGNNFGSWDVIAPGADGKKSHGAKAVMFDNDYEDVAKPDIGVIVLAEPIELPAYAELVDVSGMVKGDATILGATMIRKYIDVDAPLTLLTSLETSSAEKFGYEHGLVTKLFSEGGDSGAGLFLLAEKGRKTHQLIGVARQPEPSRSVDHFTRIDADFINWVKALKVD